MQISKGRNSFKNCSIDQIFFQDIPINFCCSLRSIQMSIILDLLKKNSFLIISVNISKSRNSVKNCSIDQIFFYRFRTFHWSFSGLWVLSLSKNHEAKVSKNWISWRPSRIFWRPSWNLSWPTLNSWSVSYRLPVYQFWRFYPLLIYSDEKWAFPTLIGIRKWSII